MKTRILLLAMALFFALPRELNAADYIYKPEGGQITITGYTGPGGNVTIPGTIDGLPVTRIGDSAFSQCMSLASVTIPNSVSSIGDDAFLSCTSLASVTIPNSVTSIGNFAFSQCTSLNAITVEGLNSVYSSIDGVLFNLNQTRLIGYPEGKTGSSYMIPNSVTSIGDYAFYYCASLAGVTIPPTVKSIGVSAFSGCANLTNVVIPEGVTRIEERTFSYCHNLVAATIPESVTSIGGAAFWSNYSRLTALFFKGDAPAFGVNIFGAWLPGDWGGEDLPPEDLVLYYLPSKNGWDAGFSYPTPNGAHELRTALWTPSVRTDDSQFGVHGNQFGFNIIWPNGAVVVVEACDDLANRNWSPVWTNTVTSGLTYFVDPEWANHSARVYRLRSP